MEFKQWKQALGAVARDMDEKAGEETMETTNDILEDTAIDVAERDLEAILKKRGKNYIGLLERTVAPTVEDFENDCAEWSNGPALFDIMRQYGQISENMPLGYFPTGTLWNFTITVNRSFFGGVSLHTTFGRVQDHMQLGVRPEDLAQGKPVAASGQIYVARRSLLRYHIDELAAKSFAAEVMRAAGYIKGKRRVSATIMPTTLRILAFKTHMRVADDIVLQVFRELSGEKFIEFEKSKDPLEQPENVCAPIEFIKTVNDKLWAHKEYRPVRLREMSGTMTSTQRSDERWEDEVQEFEDEDGR